MTKLYRATWFAISLLLAAVGCKPAEEPSSKVEVTWQIAPDPPRTGSATITVALADSLGRPIRGARVALEGTMTHPGMKPSLGEARETDPGRYETRLDLTMGGDWVLLLDATLPDGRSVRRQIDLHGVRTQ